MDIEPHNFYHLLKEYSKEDVFRGSTECLRLLNIFNYNLTEEQLSSTLVDSHLFYTFDKKNGLLDFVLSITSRKDYEQAAAKALEIVYTLINSFAKKVQPYVLNINEKCLKIVQSKAAAKVKTKALEVLLISFEKIDKCLENQESYDKIFQGVKNCLKLDHSDTVKQKEFMVVGLFAKKFSYLVTEPGLIKKYLVAQLDQEMCSKKSSGNICGIFTALGYLSEGFPLSSDNTQDKVLIDKLLKHIEKLVILKDSRNKMGNRAALSFLSANMSVFIKEMMQKWKWWHKYLLDWLSLGYEEIKVGEIALRTYVIQVSEQLSTMETEDSKPIIKHFLGWFKQLLKKEASSNMEKRLAIHGFKFFCSPMYKHLSGQETRDIFVLIMQNFETTYVLKTDSDRENWEYLPDYIQCVASFVRFQNFTTSDLYCLQKAVINLIKTFHKLKPLHHSFVIEAVVTTLFYLRKTKHFESFLESVIFQGVIWTCSHQHITDSELSSEHQQIITVKTFFHLWRGLLLLTSYTHYDKYSIFLEDRKFILNNIVNQLVKTLMILVNKLNVTVKPKDEEQTVTDIKSSYEVEHSSDYAIFLNVADFYNEVFDNVEPSKFRHCICKIINHFVNKCIKHPLVSGFYKLTSIALRVANCLTLFDRSNVTINQDVKNCQETLGKFIMTLIQRMKQYKDELLISCLHVLLEAPIIIMEPILMECVPVFVNAFQLGRSYIGLANMALTTLETWQQGMSRESYEKFVVQVVPNLDSFLRSKSLGSMMQSANIEKKRKSARVLKKRSVLVELEPELVKFQKRVMFYIGSQSSTICQAFISPDNNFEENVIGDNLHLKLPLGYSDVTLDLYLDPFLLRTIDLAMCSSDRNTRVMSCEVLQALVMIFLGHSKQMPASVLKDVDDIFKVICSSLLQLSCDIDQVVCQIFEPVFLQLIHWCTSPTRIGNSHYGVLVNVLTEGITHPTNTSLRDFSGKCINELVKWNIKQSNESTFIALPNSVKFLCNTIRYFSSHPDLNKKLGAALIFNNIYREVREERALLLDFTVEMLYSFVTSLSMLDSDDEEHRNVVLQINKAVGHLKRIIIEKHKLFLKNPSDKVIASDLETNDLKGVSKWLLVQCGSKSKFCRDTSMEMFLHIAPLSGIRLCNFVNQNFNDVFTIFESKLSNYSTLADYDGPIDTLTVLKWMQLLLCAIDGYVFIIHNSLTEVSFNEENLLLKSLEYFLKFILPRSLETVIKSENADVTAMSKEQFRSLKAVCALAILKLANAVLKNVACEKSGKFWSNELWSLIKDAVFDPYSLGMIDETTLKNELLTLLLNDLPRKSPQTNISQLVKVLKEHVETNYENQVDLKRNVTQKQRKMFAGFLTLKSTQMNRVFQTEQFAKSLVDSLMENFYAHLDGNEIFLPNMSDTSTDLCELVLEFALSTEEEFKCFVKHCFQPLTIHAKEIEFDQVTYFGVYLLIKFEKTVMKFIFEKADLFFELNDNVEIMYQMTFYILKKLGKECKTCDRFLEILLSKWTFLQMHFEHNKTEGLEYVKQLAKVSKKTAGSGIKNWMVELVNNPENMVEFEIVHFYVDVVDTLVHIMDEADSDWSIDILNKISDTFSSAISIKPGNVIIVDKLLAMLPIIKSTKLFTFVIELYVTTDVKTDLTYLIKSYMKNNVESHGVILRITMEMCLGSSRTFDEKRKLSENVVKHVFKNSTLESFENFLGENINTIIKEIRNISDLGLSTVYFGILELVFLRISIDLDNIDNDLFSNFPDLVDIVLHTVTAQKEGNKEHIRLYKCSAYKALSSIISNCFKFRENYDKLFVQVENGSDILWKSLIDKNVTFNFPMEFDSLPKQRNELVTIRSQLAVQNTENSSKSLKYIESQRLFHSSLSEDITKFDFTNSVLRTQPGMNENQPFTSENRQSQVELDGTEVNNHECMATVCGLINHQFQSGIYQLPEDDQEMVETPKWVEGIRKLLLDSKVHKNIKIFWIKVIENTMSIFRYFARLFIEPLLKFILEKHAGEDINYFVSDVIVILSSWSTLVNPNETESRLSSEVLKFLVETLNNERQAIFKYHLELIKIIVENWKAFVSVPYEELFAKFRSPVNDRKIETAIHLTSVFLVNDLCPCAEGEINRFWNALLDALDSNISTVYRPCAETLGLMLKYLHLKGVEVESYVELASMAILKADSDITKYARCLEAMAIHYPAIVNQYHLTKIFNRLSQSNLDLRVSFLKIINKRTEEICGLSDFRQENWIKYLDNENNEIQLLAMEIILKTYQSFKYDNRFLSIVKVICKNMSNPNILCRIKMYDILMTLLNDNQVNSDVASLCKEVLIQGLVDTDIETRDKIRKFWSESPMIPSEISTKFSYLTNEFYLSKCEENFLNYTAYFLLESVKQTDLEKELFAHPLEDCDFEEYKLQTNWRLQHPSVVPMFADTLRTFTEGLDDVTLGNVGMLRQTQTEFSFAPTQQTLREREISHRTNSGSSLMISSLGDEGNDDFLDPNQLKISDKYKLPKKRFLKDKSKLAQSAAHAAVGKKIRREVRRYESIKEGEKKVTIYRKYRKGDFPDVQITLESVLKPLQMLVLHDTEMAKILFTTTFKSLVEKVRNKTTFIQSISQGINNIFTSSIQFNPKVFSTLLDIILKNNKELRFEPDLIASVSQQSGLVSVGSLVLEEYLISGKFESEASTSKRGTASSTDPELNCWIKLAELYRDLQEWDLVKTVFLEKTICKDDIHDAIRYESDKNWKKAEIQYRELLQNDSLPERKGFYYESLFRCLVNLGEWKTIPDTIEDTLPPDNSCPTKWDQLWNDSLYQLKLLPWYIEGQVKDHLFSETNSTGFLQNINKSLTIPDQAEHLRQKFSEQLCTLWLTQKDTVQASKCLTDAIDSFLNEWQSLNPMFHTTRYHRIMSLRNLVEIQRFLDIESDLTEEGNTKLSNVQEYWKATATEYLPSIALNETKLLYRRLFIKILKDNPDRSYDRNVTDELSKTKILLDMEFMNAAIEQGNVALTKKYFSEYMGRNHSKLTMIFGNLLFCSGKLEEDDSARIKKYLDALEQFGKILNSPREQLYHLKCASKYFDISQALTDCLQDNVDLYAKFEEKIKRIFGDVYASPTHTAAEKLKIMVLDSTDHVALKKDQRNIIIQARVKLAYFLKNDKERQTDFVRLVLRAMQLNSSEARQIFPCILMKDTLHSDLKHVFMEESDKVPTWMFLGWIPQLLGIVDTEKVVSVSKIILNIAETYPKAIMYAYRLSKENFKFSNPEIADKARKLTEKLDELLLSDPLVDQFLEALSKVCVPLVKLGYYLSKLYNSQDIDSLMQLKEVVMQDLFIRKPDSRDSNSIQGVIYRDITVFKNDFNSIKPNLSLASIKTILQKIDVQRRAQLSHTKTCVKLKEYCPWLASFSTGKLNLELEIPGQYSGDRIPLTQHHAKISGFNQIVSVMQSKTRPIKLTMLGMDSKEYPFLIKFGEDVRQDQRIEQLFTLMNDIFASDHKPHRVLTYQVVPLTTSLGLIQWVDNSVSLDEFIKKPLKSRKTNPLAKLGENYNRFLENGSSDTEKYGKTVLKFINRRELIVAHFNTLVNEIDWGILRDAFWLTSLTTESFIAYKENFIKSYATLCVCQWILGIGDRHLQNSKVCVKNGKVLGIDFGLAFGAATQFQPVPELVPIRLTPHIIGLMEPLKEKGPFRDVMIDCMKSLKANSGSLLATMDVFAKEPSVDWLEHANKLGGLMENPETHEWYPNQKIDQAKRKLLGASSAAILIEDLSNSKKNQYTDAYIKLVKGTEQDKRCRLGGGEFLNVEDQIDCLLDHATDYSLLGVTYRGWSPWI